MNKLIAWCAAHAKFLTAAAGIGLTVAVHVWGTDNPYVAAALFAATLLGVHQVPNMYSGPPASQHPVPQERPGPGTQTPHTLQVPASPVPASPPQHASPPAATPGQEAGTGLS